MPELHLTCPVCQTQVDKDYPTHLNSKTQAPLARDLFEGQLFRFECPTCGAERQLTYQFLYHNPQAAYMIFLLPHYLEDKDHLEEDLEQILAGLNFSLDHYQLRLVTTVPELLEKIQILESGHDDRIIEAVKILTDGLFATEKPDTPVKARYYYPSKGAERILYVTDQDQILVDLHQKLIDFVKGKYRKILEEDLRGDFHYIGYRWALDLLEGKKPESQPASDNEK